MDDCFPYGRVRSISILTGIGETYLGRDLNPNTEYKSPAFYFLQVQCALDEIDPACGDKHWRMVEKFRELSRPRTGTGSLCLKALALCNKRESEDVSDALIEERPLGDQLDEVLQQIAAAERHRDALIERIEANASIHAVPLRGAANGVRR